MLALDCVVFGIHQTGVKALCLRAGAAALRLFGGAQCVTAKRGDCPTPLQLVEGVELPLERAELVLAVRGDAPVRALDACRAKPATFAAAPDCANHGRVFWVPVVLTIDGWA